mgnify:CR=1 FL=1
MTASTSGRAAAAYTRSCEALGSSTSLTSTRIGGELSRANPLGGYVGTEPDKPDVGCKLLLQTQLLHASLSRLITAQIT